MLTVVPSVFVHRCLVAQAVSVSSSVIAQWSTHRCEGKAGVVCQKAVTTTTTTTTYVDGNDIVLINTFKYIFTCFYMNTLFFSDILVHFFIHVLHMNQSGTLTLWKNHFR